MVCFRMSVVNSLLLYITWPWSQPILDKSIWTKMCANWICKCFFLVIVAQDKSYLQNIFTIVGILNNLNMIYICGMMWIRYLLVVGWFLFCCCCYFFIPLTKIMTKAIYKIKGLIGLMVSEGQSPVGGVESWWQE